MEDETRIDGVRLGRIEICDGLVRVVPSGGELARQIEDLEEELDLVNGKLNELMRYLHVKVEENPRTGGIRIDGK